MSAQRVAIFIDGSNFVNCLARIFLGFPLLEPFIAEIVGADELVVSRFYYSPLQDGPYRAAWQRFEASYRGSSLVEFWHGHRDQDGREKEVDVALAVDLVLGAAQDTYDRAVVVGGDGDHRYAIEVAGRMKPILVVLIEEQKASAVRHLASKTKSLHRQGLGVRYREFSGAELMRLGVCEEGQFTPRPARTSS